MAEFEVSEQQSLLGLSLYVLACQSLRSMESCTLGLICRLDGLGPMIWAPLSEVAYIGRSLIYASTFVAFVCLSILAATVTTWHSFLTVRFFQAFFGSPCLAIGGASMHYLFPNSYVPYSLVFWIAAAYCGPALGPLIASYLVPDKGWRWRMWEVTWLAVPTLALILTLPETQQSTLHNRRATTDIMQLNTKTARTWGSIVRSAVKSLGDAVVRPLQIASLDPAVVVANFYIAFMYGTYYTFFDAIPRVYSQKYRFGVGNLGLTFLSVFVACAIGGTTYSAYIWRLSKRAQQTWLDEPEICLRPALFASFLPPIGLFIFGWTSDGQIPWIVNLLGVVIYAVGIFIILECMSVYLPRIYPEYAASLFAANDFCRSILAAAAVHLSVPLYDRLGVAIGVSILGALSVLGIPGMWLIYRKGAALRAKSRFVIRESSLH
jgi:DHA1 family multidrug resistance protein-like MFS transporter